MESKKFTLYGFEYELSENGSLSVLRESGWTTIEPKYVRIKNGMYPRYALYEKGYDFTEENNHLIQRYETACAQFNASLPSVWSNEVERGEIVSRNIGDIVAPKPPTLYPKTGWRRFYMNHGSLVLKYWYWVEDSKVYPSFIDWDTNNLSVYNIAYLTREDVIRPWQRKWVSSGIVNTVLANCWRFTIPYIAKALSLSTTTVVRIIYWSGKFASLWDRKTYAWNIRSCRGSFYNAICYDWEIEIDFINRVLCRWSNDNLYRQYVSKGSRWIRNGSGRMGFWEWMWKYWRDDNVSKYLMKKWVELNSEYIDNVEELLNFINNWSLGGDRCWNLERYDSYVSSNLYRMPQRVSSIGNVHCSLQNVWVDNRERTLWDLSDFQLVNAFDYCMWDFASITDWKSVIDSFEEEPDFDRFIENWYSSREEFWLWYESLLGWWTIKDFRWNYEELLRSIIL